MQTCKVYLIAIFRAIIRPVIDGLILLLAIFWLVGSAWYLMNVLGCAILEGKLVLICQMDRCTAKAINVEWCFFWIAVIFWIFTAAIYTHYRVSKELHMESSGDEIAEKTA